MRNIKKDGSARMASYLGTRKAIREEKVASRTPGIIASVPAVPSDRSEGTGLKLALVGL